MVDSSSSHVPAVHQYPEIREYMTPSPQTISRNRSLSAAGRLMREHHLRHLPVLDGGRIVGVISERDLFLIESLPGVNPTDVRVEEAMIQDVFTVTPNTPVAEAIETMIGRKVGSVVVCEGNRVIGVFTTIDALCALHHLLERH
jgi:acetoin utilization protein AcuB